MNKKTIIILFVFLVSAIIGFMCQKEALMPNAPDGQVRNCSIVLFKDMRGKDSKDIIQIIRGEYVANSPNESKRILINPSGTYYIMNQDSSYVEIVGSGFLQAKPRKEDFELIPSRSVDSVLSGSFVYCDGILINQTLDIRFIRFCYCTL